MVKNVMTRRIILPLPPHPSARVEILLVLKENKKLVEFNRKSVKKVKVNNVDAFEGVVIEAEDRPDIHIPGQLYLKRTSRRRCMRIQVTRSLKLSFIHTKTRIKRTNSFNC